MAKDQEVGRIACGDRATHEPSPQAVSALPGEYPLRGGGFLGRSRRAFAQVAMAAKAIDDPEGARALLGALERSKRQQLELTKPIEAFVSPCSKPPSPNRKGRKSRKAKSPEELQAEAEQARRLKLTEAGVPEHRVSGERINDFKVAEFSDIVKNRADKRTLFRAVDTLDRWFEQGGPGFEEPQERAIKHVRGLWAKLGTQRLCANYEGSIPGAANDAEGEVFARLQLAEYEDQIPRAYWWAFESVVRWDMPAGRAGSHLASTSTQQQAHAKAAVGFVASLIAQWRGY